VRGTYRERQPFKPAYQVNDWIRAKELLVIDPEGNNLGILSREAALAKAHEYNLDLIVVGEKSNPPVARIIDFSKFKYERSKADAKKRKSGKGSEMKQLRFNPNIGDNDLEIRVKRSREFLEKGEKVKLIVPLRGRYTGRREIGEEKLTRVYEALTDIAEVEKDRWMEGKLLMMIIKSKK
jgi:translation initiation factor IF-3